MNAGEIHDIRIASVSIYLQVPAGCVVFQGLHMLSWENKLAIVPDGN